MNRMIFVTLLCVSWISAVCVADEVYLVNGDRVTGKVTTLADNKLTVESDLAGKLTIDLNNVTTFKTNAPVEIQMKDGTAFKKQISKAETGRFAVEGDQNLKNQDFNVASITAINPPVKEEPKWHGDISGAITSTHGNTNTLSESFSINLNRRSDIDRTLLSFDYLYGKQEVTQDDGTKKKVETQNQWKARGAYDYFFSKKLFGFIDARYEKDKIAALERRTAIGLGAGYQWIESEPFNFSTQAGIATRSEVYYDDHNPATKDTSNQMSAQMGYHLDKKLTQTLTFINDLTYYPSLETGSDYFLTTTGELRAKLTDLIFANFKAVLDFDSTPAPGKGKSDVKYILGIGCTF
jgi:putative salt-induced outer membrane protein YdiY